jgi:SAM-dependent methyltransferase
VDIIIAEHVIEHIYGVHHAMKDIKKALKPGGILIVDIPDAGLFALERPEAAPILDFSQVHINHFRMLDMLKLANNYDLELIETHEYHERMGGCRMYVFAKDKLIIGRRSRWFVERNIAEKMNKLRELGDREVAVWGFGDIAAHCLAKVHINVKYFICNDPAFKGQRIHGLPVFEEPQSNIPIVVIAQSQKGLLLDKIKSMNLKNEVIVI